MKIVRRMIAPFADIALLILPNGEDMILKRLCGSRRLRQLHTGFAEAFDFLSRPDLATLPTGKYEIDGTRVYALVQEYESKGQDNAKLEAHRRYIDIQYTIDGNEVMGYRHTQDCTPDDKSWDENRDICFFTDQPDFWFPVPANSFAIFFPDDAHAPMAGTGKIRKVVVKIEA